MEVDGHGLVGVLNLYGEEMSVRDANTARAQLKESYEADIQSLLMEKEREREREEIDREVLRGV